MIHNNRPASMDRKTFVTARREQREELAAKAFLIVLIAALIVSVIVIFAGDALAEERTETVITLAAFAAVDYHQSVEIFSRPGTYELNPILGSDPSRRDMAVFGAAGLALVALLERAGAPDWMLRSITETERINIEMNRELLNGRRRETLCYVFSARW